jgi:putative endopeptidase
MSEKIDFYSFVNQEWIDNNKIPEGYSKWSTFHEIDKENKEKLLLLINQIDENNIEYGKVKILFNQFLNREEKLKNKIDEVNVFLDDIKKIKKKKDLSKFICDKFISFGIETPLMFSVNPDLDDSNINILHITSSGLGLPDKDYYFDKKHKKILDEYKKFMKKYLSLFGDFNFDNIFLIEEKLAELTYSKIENRNPHLMNNKYDLEVIDCNFKKFKIKDILEYLNLKPDRKINIVNPKLIRRYHEMWKCITIKNWIDFYSWIYLRNIGQILSKETDDIIFNFYSGVLNGVYKMKPREERALDFIDLKLGMILSKIYVKQYFPKEKRELILDLVSSIKNTFKNRLKINKWMSPETKEKALEKLKKMNFKIISPAENEWRNFDELKVLNDLSIIQNIMNINKFEIDYKYSKLNKAVDKTEWFMNPHDVNAYYSPNYNEIVFPAGILQGEFFGDDMIKNFGGIGVVIGHEIIHGFDDEGRKFDCYGNLQNWFTKQDIINFEEKSKKLENQFNKLSINNIKLNGKLTLGENIADLGGVIISYNAMEEYMKDKSITDDDRKMFFTSFAKVWKSKSTPESMELQLTIDPHSPPEFRVNQILGNFKPFLNIYNISENDNMYVNDRVDIW